MRINNYTGYKINMLKVLQKTKQKNKQGRPLYKCQCDCGKIVYYTSADLKQCVSCGCYRKAGKQIREKTLKKMKYVENTSIALISKTTTNSNNTSGFRGVSFDKTRKKYRAYIKLKYKTKHLGRFKTFEEAKQARLKAEELYYKPIINKYKKEQKSEQR